MEAAEIAGLSATRPSSSSRAIPAAPTALLLLRSRRRESKAKKGRDGRRFPAISQTAGSITQIQLHKKPDTSLSGDSSGIVRA